jgi:hypothetical protein
LCGENQKLTNSCLAFDQIRSAPIVAARASLRPYSCVHRAIITFNPHHVHSQALLGFSDEPEPKIH